MAILRRCGYQMRIFAGGTPLLYQGQPLKSTRRGRLSAACCDCCHETGNSCKKGLAFAQNKPKLKLPPRPGPGSSGQPVSGSPSTPEAGCPPLSFWAAFPTGFEPFQTASSPLSIAVSASAPPISLDLCSKASCSHSRLVYRQQPLRAQPVFQQARPLVQRRIAFAQAAAVRAVGEDVHLRRHARLDQRLVRSPGSAPPEPSGR